MIGVLASPAEHPVVREFFELFKTPWEFHRAEAHYDVVLCAGELTTDIAGQFVLIYAGKEISFDRENSLAVAAQKQNIVLQDETGRLPIYGSCVAFAGRSETALTEATSRQPAVATIAAAGQTVVRVGYDLFAEVRHLLTTGQPTAHATVPTLDRHIALLRNWIVAAGVRLVEIPPVPVGHDFIVCLTHDVDHVGIRNHKFDHTMFGFLYRATVGSAVNVGRGRISFGQFAINLLAAFKLPFVHLGWARDFWYQFGRYLELEAGVNSTFFVVPFKGRPGRSESGSQPAKRATAYDVTDIAADLGQLQSANREIGLHGIDAWLDDAQGRVERERIASVTGSSPVGVRMHWLCFNAESSAKLERAGFAYDSTVGYNECIGYRAGTSQVFRPLTADTLRELPMHIMDTALFYPCYLNLSPKAAATAVAEVIQSTRQFGGVITINWHDRSLAPERLWDAFYTNLIRSLKEQDAWFATAAQAVGWFNQRRAVTFANGTAHLGGAKKLSSADLPGLRIRIHNPSSNGLKTADKFSDRPLNATADECLAMPA